MSSVNNQSFNSSFPNPKAFCLIEQTRTSNTLLNRSDDNVHLDLFLVGEYLPFFTRVPDATFMSHIEALYKGIPSISSLLSFWHELVLISLDTFLAFIHMIIWLSLLLC